MILGPQATLITFKNFRFVITHLPHDCNMSPFVEDLEQHGTKLLIRVCSGHYDLSSLNIARIPVLEMKYPDGTFPSRAIISQWIFIVQSHFKTNPRTAIAVHCKSGLGRSAVLVAIALMESGVPGPEAIDMIRKKRKGTFNSFQCEKILSYHSQNRLYAAANEVINDDDLGSIDDESTF